MWSILTTHAICALVVWCEPLWAVDGRKGVWSPTPPICERWSHQFYKAYLPSPMSFGSKVLQYSVGNNNVVKNFQGLHKTT